MATSNRRRSLARTFAYAVMLLAPAAVGCQVNTGGQTLPSPYYLKDDVQYFAPGPQFPLTNEAAAQGVQKTEATRIHQ